MKTVLTAVIYHSGFGHTAIAAEAVVKGAGKHGQAVLIRIADDGSITDAEWQTLEDADAIIFGSPTYMGSASGPFKIFQDTSSKPWFRQAWKNKIAGGFTNSSSINGDKLNTLQQFAILAAQHGMIWVGQTEMPPQMTDVPNQRDAKLINRLGSALGVMTHAEDTAPEGSISEGDLKTAELYGERIVEIASRFSL